MLPSTRCYGIVQSLRGAQANPRPERRVDAQVRHLSVQIRQPRDVCRPLRGPGHDGTQLRQAEVQHSSCTPQFQGSAAGGGSGWLPHLDSNYLPGLRMVREIDEHVARANGTRATCLLHRGVHLTLHVAVKGVKLLCLLGCPLGLLEGFPKGFSVAHDDGQGTPVRSAA
eukprot:scaffold518_cov388-Prasinococcus_capsulatus_cf.AAC.54